MIKIFFSTPMFGLDEREVLKKYEDLNSALGGREGVDYIILDNYHKPDPPQDLKGYDAIRMWYLATSLELMAKADLIIFSYDWSSGRGCRIEMNVAREYKKGILYLTKDLKVRKVIRRGKNC